MSLLLMYTNCKKQKITFNLHVCQIRILERKKNYIEKGLHAV